MLPDDTAPTDRLLRLPEVKALTGLARSTIYDHMERGTFPQPYRLGPRCVAWLASEIDAWIAALPSRLEAPAR